LKNCVSCITHIELPKRPGSVYWPEYLTLYFRCPLRCLVLWKSQQFFLPFFVDWWPTLTKKCNISLKFVTEVCCWTDTYTGHCLASCFRRVWSFDSWLCSRHRVPVYSLHCQVRWTWLQKPNQKPKCYDFIEKRAMEIPNICFSWNLKTCFRKCVLSFF